MQDLRGTEPSRRGIRDLKMQGLQPPGAREENAVEKKDI